ncbi:NADH-quinone oxidoreductase subunit J [Lapillicoccus jejuensis]|uniref:NADH-quinone oxidoreductase subunit J n=1 Tax=Lapillicoccus jejuensis TaxID=402171 RepID=A0A542DX34_9MICO|nr:NADH-quinone oxidoreductase subunit J [Lapillicoccus jejuensis]TQJ07635.1 NADH-quinone oxidoreductase subunit J [Lapillicoccus jejuensis]
MASTGEAVAFWILGILMVVAALGLIFARKAVHAALCMAFVMVNLGVLYVMESAPFLGVVQVFVYTGAVMMLFLFVLMLVGVDSADSVVETIKGQRTWAWVLGVGLAVLMLASLRTATLPTAVGLDAVNNPADGSGGGNVSGVAQLIFGQYVWAFELTSALLITAAIGAMVLAHRERLGEKLGQREWAERRVRENKFVAGLPAPGVYARHNAVDTPALLPDGTPSALSVSRVLVSRDQVSRPDDYHAAEAAIEAEIEEGITR